MIPRILCGLLIALIASPAAQDGSPVIDNELVQVTRQRLDPGATLSTEMPPALIVFLNVHNAMLTAAERQEEVRGARGGFVWHSGGKIHLENRGEHVLELALVVPKFKPATEDVSDVLSNRGVVFENSLLHVKRFGFGPNAKPVTRSSRVDHVLPALVIHLSAAQISLRQADGHVERVRMEAGQIRYQAREFYFSGGNPPANPSGENGAVARVMRIQLKAGR